MAGPVSNYVEEILAAMQEAAQRQGAYKRYAPDAYGQTLQDGTPLPPDAVVPQDVGAMVEGMQKARR